MQHLTIKDLMVRWQCSESFVRKLLGRHKLSYIKINSAIRVTVAEVQRFETERTRTAEIAKAERATLKSMLNDISDRVLKARKQ